MSAIATFVLLPKSNIDGLRKAATPTKRLFGAPEDMLHDYLDEHGHPAAEFYGSGYVLGTVLTFLKEQRGLDLMHSEYDELGEYLSKERQATYFVFTEEHKRLYSEQLSAEIFSQSELCEYFNKFNEVAEIEIGEAMLDGIRALQESLEQLDADSVIIFGIV